VLQAAPPPFRRWERLVSDAAQPAGMFVAALAVLLAIRWFLLSWIEGRGSDERTPSGRALVIFSTPTLYWCFAGAAALTLRYAELPEQLSTVAYHAIFVSLIVSVSHLGGTAALWMLRIYREKQGMPIAVAGMSRTLIRVLFAILALMTVLGYFGISILPLLTALGFLGLGFALSVKDSLASFFAGIHILSERPIFVGDFIQLANGKEGTVVDIGWRATRIQTGTNNLIIIPNYEITNGTLINFSLPDRRVVVEIPIVVGLDADPDMVCDLALEEAARVPEVLPEPAPAMRLDPGVLPTHIQFKLVVSLSDRLIQGRVKSEIAMRILRRFRAEGVAMPKSEAALLAQSN
jgi:small-conductance mechanosensitive channel